MRKSIAIILFVGFIVSCNKKKYFDGPSFYQDGFENYNLLKDLLPDEDRLWSFTQLTRGLNSITVDTSKSHSGKRSLKFEAEKSQSGSLSKCSIAKQNMAFWEGETVRFSAWYYLEGSEDLEWLFLMDLEEQTPIGAGPGMRLALVENKLRIEYKFNQKDIIQQPGNELEFPRDQWVEIVWEVKLSRKHNGGVKLWQNGKLLIDSKKNVTLPQDILYFQQGTKGMYSSGEIGITANSYDNNCVLWVDDVKLEKVN